MEIRVENLHFIYNPGTPLEVRALEGVSFVLEPGRVLGVLGGTGSGKTTLIKNLNGLLEPTSGRVLLDGHKANRLGARARQRVGVVFQRPERQLFESTVSLDIAFALRTAGGLTEGEIDERVRSAASMVGLDLDLTGRRSPLSLSDGAKRKAAIAGVLVNDPEVLVLDEPAVGLDPPSTEELVCMIERFVTREGKSVIVVSHDMEPFLSTLDELFVLDGGKAAAVGSPADVCERIEQDSPLRDLLPPLALYAQELRKVCAGLPRNEFRIPVLADLVAHMYGERGGEE